MKFTNKTEIIFTAIIGLTTVPAFKFFPAVSTHLLMFAICAVIYRGIDNIVHPCAGLYTKLINVFAVLFLSYAAFIIGDNILEYHKTGFIGPTSDFSVVKAYLFFIGTITMIFSISYGFDFLREYFAKRKTNERV